jgi:YD repeat-containing protein
VLRNTRSTWTPTGKVATDANGNTTRYAYDLLDRQVTLTDAMGRVTEFTYDNVGRPRMTLQSLRQSLDGHARADLDRRRR